jgi:hypothetical protein
MKRVRVDSLHRLVLAFVAFSASTFAAAPTANLVGYWTFDEGAGTTAQDSSGNHFNATITSPSWIAGGKINKALHFNSSSYALAPTITTGNAFSLSVWVNPDTASQAGWTRILETQYNGGYYLGTDGTGKKYKFIVNTAAGSSNSACSYGCAEGGMVTTGWHLVTATYSGTTALLYVDGVQVASDTFTPPVFQGNLYIARYYGGSGYNWVGSLDEVRLYSRALTATEVGQIFAFTSDTQGPSVSISAPLANATVSNVVSITANAQDNVSVASVQFQVDGNNVGVPSTTFPYSTSWDTTQGSNGLHTLTAIATDGAGNPTTSGGIIVTVNNNLSAPLISNISATLSSSSTAAIGWVTDKLADSQVDYGTDTNYANSTPLNSSLVTTHSANLSNLLPSTLYHFRVKSRDSVGNLATSLDQTFSTAPVQSWTVGWNELPNTQMKSVCPPVGYLGAVDFQGNPYDFPGWCRMVIASWSGGIADTTRNRLVFWGGGHANYGGNEIYALNLAQNPATLLRLNDPSVPLNPSNSNTCVTTLSDGKPNSRHTYNNLTYIAHADRMFAMNGAVAYGSGGHNNDTWTLELGPLQWHRMDPVNGNPQPMTYYTNPGDVVAYDPNTLKSS